MVLRLTWFGHLDSRSAPTSQVITPSTVCKRHLDYYMTTALLDAALIDCTRKTPPWVICKTAPFILSGMLFANAHKSAWLFNTSAARIFCVIIYKVYNWNRKAHYIKIDTLNLLAWLHRR